MLTSTASPTLPLTETLRLDRLERFRLIEIISLWEGRLTTATLRNAFGISRQQASKDINTYLNHLSPDNLDYDKSLKCYVPAADFNPVFTSGQASEYLNWLQSQQHSIEVITSGENKPTGQYTEIIALPSHPISPPVLRPIIAAIRNRTSIQADYISLSSERTKTRTLTPHTLVNSGIRWHVRAYCHDQNEFRDFVISRFQNTPKAVSAQGPALNKDRHWHKKVTLKITPHPKLSNTQQQIIAKDYGMKRKQLKLTTKAALAHYWLQYFRIDLKAQTKPALENPIVLANQTDIAPYLFKTAQ